MKNYSKGPCIFPFFSVQTSNRNSLVMHLKTRRIEIAGATPHPNSEWMQQVGRNLTDCVDGFFRSSTHVILDRDTKHLPLRQILKSSDIEAVALPPQES